jgi:hypothetical protein
MGRAWSAGKVSILPGAEGVFHALFDPRCKSSTREHVRWFRTIPFLLDFCVKDRAAPRCRRPKSQPGCCSWESDQAHLTGIHLNSRAGNRGLAQPRQAPLRWGFLIAAS